ncbi:MAG: hypothetical protein ACRESZ_00160 [Methylococcales bacterium]
MIQSWYLVRIARRCTILVEYRAAIKPRFTEYCSVPVQGYFS